MSSEQAYHPDIMPEEYGAEQCYNRAVAELESLISYYQEDELLAESLGLSKRYRKGINSFASHDDLYSLARREHARSVAFLSGTDAEAPTILDVWKEAAGSLHEQILNCHINKGLMPADLPKFTPPPEVYELDEAGREELSSFFDFEKRSYKAARLGTGVKNKIG